LDRIIYKDHYSIPLVVDLLDVSQKARIYTKIDLRSIYYFIKIAEEDEWKTTFRTWYGLYKWLVMPFGLSNAPSAFQRLMNKIFTDLLDICVVIYLDNILIYSDILKDHKQQVKEVLCQLWAHRLYISPVKYIFHKEKIKFLGYILGSEKIQMDLEKMCIIKEWSIPC